MVMIVTTMMTMLRPPCPILGEHTRGPTGLTLVHHCLCGTMDVLMLPLYVAGVGS